MAISNTHSKIPKPKPLEVFLWEGVNRKGKKIKGEFSAVNLIELKAQLRKQGITPLKTKKKSKPFLGLGGDPAIGSKDISVVTRQIATMLGAGVPLVQTIEMIGKGNANGNIRKLLGDIGNKVQSGMPFSDCIREHPKYFDDLYCDLVASGEQSGALETIFDRIAIYKEKAEVLRSKIKKAMTYPIAVLVIAAIVTSILLIFVVPTFAEIFEGFGAELPGFTLFVVGISDFMVAYWWVALAFIFAIGYIYKQAHLKSQDFRDKVDVIVLRLPIVGMILDKAAIARFARTLSTTFAAGVPLIDALDSAAGASGNAVYRDGIKEVNSEVSSGMQMNLAMRNVSMFPDMVVQMVAIGEESGALDDMLAKVATIYEQEVDDAVDNLTALLEPLIMAVLGVVIGGLIIAMYLPIFAMGSII